MSGSRKQDFDFQAYFSEEKNDLTSVQVPEFKVRFKYLNKFEQVKYGVAKAFKKALECKPKPALLHSLEPAVLTESKCEEEKVYVTVLLDDCVNVAKELNAEFPGKVAMLNMANRVSVGGDAFNGSFAQEEYLFCVSDLAISLLEFAKNTGGYQALDRHNHLRPYFAEASIKPTDVLYSKNTVFKAKEPRNFFCNDLESKEQYSVGIISAAALRFDPATEKFYDIQQEDGKSVYVKYDDIEAAKILAGNIYNQIHTALKYGNKGIVLSALGCGAFQNDPNYIAMLYRNILELPEFYGKLKVKFAIFDKKNWIPFELMFKAPLVKKNFIEAKQIREVIGFSEFLQLRPLFKVDSTFFNKPKEVPQAEIDFEEEFLGNIKFI